MTAVNHETVSQADTTERAYEIDPAILLRIKQLGDAGLRAAMGMLKGEKTD